MCWGINFVHAIVHGHFIMLTIFVLLIIDDTVQCIMQLNIFIHCWFIHLIAFHSLTFSHSLSWITEQLFYCVFREQTRFHSKYTIQTIFWLFFCKNKHKLSNQTCDKNKNIKKKCIYKLYTIYLYVFIYIVELNQYCDNRTCLLLHNHLFFTALCKISFHFIKLFYFFIATFYIFFLILFFGLN